MIDLRKNNGPRHPWEPFPVHIRLGNDGFRYAVDYHANISVGNHYLDNLGWLYKYLPTDCVSTNGNNGSAVILKTNNPNLKAVGLYHENI